MNEIPIVNGTMPNEAAEMFISKLKRDHLVNHPVPVRFKSLNHALLFAAGWPHCATYGSVETDSGHGSRMNPDYPDCPYELEVRIVPSKNFNERKPVQIEP